MNGPLERLARAFGIDAGTKKETVAAMLANGRGRAGGYWLQLVTAMVIATLGLVVGSGAVVIGAMLVSPLMTPIIHFGMGWAVGSPVLVLRSAIRIAGSSVVVVAGAAAIVVALPFSEVTSEISARMSPTALDLAIAGCCAVAGIYAAIRPGSDTSSTAAGTAIGIALVPPLCVVGYGFGTGVRRIAAGAALIFTANFCAIVLVSVVGFLLFSFSSVPIGELERTHADEFTPTRLSGRIARRLSQFFSLRASRVVRIVMPLALVLVVFVPLRSALAEVAWEIRVRSTVQAAMRDLPGETVQSVVRIEDRRVTVRVVVIGDAERAANIRATLRARLADVVSDKQMSIEVATVADSESLARAEAAMRDHPAPALPAPVEPDRALARAEVERSLAAWPVGACGPILSWQVGFAGDGGAAALTVLHLGAPLGAAAEEVLERSVERALGEPVRVRDVPLATAPLERAASDATDWLVSISRELERVDALDASASEPRACVTLASGAPEADMRRAITALRSHPRAIITREDTPYWSFRWSTKDCASPSDGGSSDANATIADAGDASD